MIYFIGDSFTNFLSQEPEIKKQQESFPWDESKWVPPDKAGSAVYRDCIFVWQHAKTAYRMTVERMQNLVDKHNVVINPDSTILFLFGAVDIWTLYKHGNTEEVVNIYINNCLEFAAKHQCKPILVEPFHNGNKIEYDIFIEELRGKCKEASIPCIQVQGINMPLDRNFKSADIWYHMSFDQAKACSDYIIDLVEGSIDVNSR